MIVNINGRDYKNKRTQQIRFLVSLSMLCANTNRSTYWYEPHLALYRSQNIMPSGTYIMPVFDKPLRKLVGITLKIHVSVSHGPLLLHSNTQIPCLVVMWPFSVPMTESISQERWIGVDVNNVTWGCGPNIEDGHNLLTNL